VKRTVGGGGCMGVVWSTYTKTYTYKRVSIKQRFGTCPTSLHYGIFVFVLCSSTTYHTMFKLTTIAKQMDEPNHATVKV
jgi:hypothetical protein